MELHQLEYLVAVAEEANFTRAAARLHVAQPGVSAQIRKLERELGQHVFDRSGRAVRLTEAGAAVLPYARMALAAVDAARGAADEVAGLLRGRLAVGVMNAGPTVTFADRLAAFHAEHPGVDIMLSEANPAVLLDGVRSAALDLAVVGLSDEPLPDLASRVLSEDSLVAAVGIEHPLAGRSALSIAELRDLPLITLPHGNGMRARFEQACAVAGFAPHVAFETSNFDVLVRLVVGGLGVAIAPAPLIAMSVEPLRVIALEPDIRVRIVIVWRADGPRSSAALAFLADLRERRPDAQIR